MKIEKGKLYRTRTNHLVEIYTIGSDYVFGAIDRGWGWNSITWDLDGIHGSNNDLDIVSVWDIECPITKLVSKCECGSVKLGSDRHSTWCPKYDNNY